MFSQNQTGQAGRQGTRESGTFRVAPRATAIDSVGWIRDRLGEMQSKLSAAEAEIARLRAELAAARHESPARSLPELDLSSIRRGVSYYCHPDRGGDAALMCKLNILFDHLAEQTDGVRVSVARRAA